MLRLIIIPIRYVTMEKYEGLLSPIIMHISLQVSGKNSPYVHVTEVNNNSLIATAVPAKSDSDLIQLLSKTLTCTLHLS